MSWQGELTTMVRHLINDTDEDNYTYSDSRLETTVLVAAQLVNKEVDFESTYLIDVEQCTLSPDPTDPTDALADANKDDGFIALVSLKAACIILGSEMKTQGLKAVRVVDGPSSVDYTAVAQHVRFLYEFACKQYEQYKFNFQACNNNVGKAVLTPYAPGALGIQRPSDYYGNFR